MQLAVEPTVAEDALTTDYYKGECHGVHGSLANEAGFFIRTAPVLAPPLTAGLKDVALPQ